MKKLPLVRLDYYQYCVETWIEILKLIPFSKIDSIVDICCGWAPKIELALLETDFTGTVFALDKSKDNLSILKSLIDPFPKKFRIRYLVKDIVKNSPKPLPVKPDLIIGNHILDDLFIDYYCHKSRLSRDNLYLDIEEMSYIWKKIISSKKVRDEVLDRVLSFFIQNLKPQGILILTQYTGYQERLYGKGEWARYCQETLKILKDQLLSDKIFRENNQEIFLFNNIKNPYFTEENIIVLEKR
jgi:hypothetical protein